jgi:hypothetical protein
VAIGSSQNNDRLDPEAMRRGGIIAESGAEVDTASSSRTMMTLYESDSEGTGNVGSELVSRTSRFKYGEIESMDEIEKSPYEPNKSAEAAEPLFEKLKMLLLSQEELHGEAQDMDGVPTLTVQRETIKMFGENLAQAFVKAYYTIGKSGMLFSPPWVDHKECKIRNVKCGWIPKNMMLLLLQHQRFARANEVSLQSVISNLGVTGIFFDALKDWEFNEPRLLHNAPSIHFKSKKKECFKCVIFIARAYRCSKIVRQNQKKNDNCRLEEYAPRLYAKVKQCLKILNENVKISEKKLPAYLSEKESAAQLQAKKRATKEFFGSIANKKRRLNTSEQEIPRLGSLKSLGSTLSSSTYSPVMVDPVSEPTPDLPVDTARSPIPTGELLERAESKYRQLGRVIKKLKRQVNQEREQLKEELRREILEEMVQERSSQLVLNASGARVLSTRRQAGRPGGKK